MKELAGGRVLVEIAAPYITRITLNDPERRNALDLDMLAALHEQLGELACGETRVLILTGTGRAFCSGFNISRIQGVPKEVGAGEEVRSDTLPIAFCRRLYEFPVPTIAMLNGHTFGLGGEIAASCDFRLSWKHGHFGMPPAKLGLCYHHEGLKKFVDLVGPAIAQEMFFTGEPLTMSQAAEVGLVTHLVDKDELAERTMTLAESIAASAPLAVRNMKRSFRAIAAGAGLPEELEKELHGLQRECFASQDLLEGRLAFLEKRAPRFKGR